MKYIKNNIYYMEIEISGRLDKVISKIRNINGDEISYIDIAGVSENAFVCESKYILKKEQIKKQIYLGNNLTLSELKIKYPQFFV